MPRKKTESLDADLFLRSINIAFDSNHPERISHFRPTTKCTSLVRALIGLESDRAFFLVAPYGSGKSLTSSYVVHLVENSKKSSDVRRAINKRLDVVSPDLAKLSERRRASKTKRGIAIAIHGRTENLGEEIKQSAIASMKRSGLGRNTRGLSSLDSSDPIEVIKCIKEVCTKNSCDTVTIIWDEFGRHLESLVAEGRGDELSEIQSIAEYVSRSQKIKMTFCLILHQGLLHYASGIPQAMRTDWKKVEGRFKTIQYVDDSKEIYRLVGEVASSRRPTDFDPKKLSGKAKKCLELGLFSEFKSRELNEVLKSAFPLEPATLYLLPRVSARVAQNERTLFSFLYSCDLSKPVTPSHLYKFFASSMRSDTAVGGTHRQWLETESAVSKLPSDDTGVDVLKTACLLGLGTSGERSRTNKPLLQFAARGYSETSTNKPIKQLLDKKLLLHRQHNDDISVWHGTDVDLRGRLDDERIKLSNGFDLVEFLTKEAAPPVWKPIEYNSDFCIRRYLTGEYVTGSGFGSFANFELVVDKLPADDDGRVFYLLANDVDELKQAEKSASEFVGDERMLVVIPREPVPLFEAAVEVAALQRMQLDSDLLDSDPLALAELQQMTDDAFDHLQKLVDRLVMPCKGGPRWFHNGKEIEATSPRVLRHQLSVVMEEVFPSTPRLNNETINRKKPSGTLVNSRKKLVMAILERHGQEELGIQGYYPDKAMFNTLLLHTGLYRYDQKTKAWGYAHSKSIKENKGLKKLWNELQQFLTAPLEKPKSFAELIQKLKSPPFGMRAGVLPILIAAAFRAFPSAISIMHKGEYLTDILPSNMEDLCKNPIHYQLFVLDIDDQKQKFLRDCHKFFSTAAKYEIEENDLVRLTFDALEAWKHQLPPAAITSRQISEETLRFRAAIVRTRDPIQLFFTEIPKALGKSIDKPKSLMLALKKCCNELQDVTSVYYEQAEKAIRDNLSAGGANSFDDVRDLAKTWAGYFSSSFIGKLSDGVAKGFISRLSLDYDSEQLMVDSLASLLVKKSVRRWDDSIVAIFDREINNIVVKIENAARSSPNRDKSLKAGLSHLLAGRLSGLYQQLIEVVGEEVAKEQLANIIQEGSHSNADDHGSSRESVKS